MLCCLLLGPDCSYTLQVPTTPACTWWNRPEEDPSSGKLESTHPSRTSVKYDQVFFVSSQSLDIRNATTSTPGTLNDLTTDLIMANNNNNNSAGSGVNRVQVVLSGFSKMLFCFVQAKTLCRYGMYFLAALVLVCVDVIVMSSA